MNNTNKCIFHKGDKVRIAKPLRYRFGFALSRGAVMEVVEDSRDGVILCKRENSDSPICYSLLTHQVEPCEPKDDYMWFYLCKESKCNACVVYSDRFGFLCNESGKEGFVKSVSKASRYRKYDALKIAGLLRKENGGEWDVLRVCKDGEGEED